MSKKGITTTVAAIAIIAAIVVGMLAGIEASPYIIPPPVTSQQYDALRAQLNQTTAEYNALRAQLNQTTSNLTRTQADLGNALADVKDLDTALVGVGSEAPIKTNLSGVIQIGAILSLSGDLASYGENEKVAADLAAEQINDFLKASGANWTLQIAYEDTQTKPDICLEKVESLAARGIKLLIGPLSSAEVRNIKGYCDSNKILAISQSSTAPDLAIPNDYIFRFCPTDKAGQGPAIGRILYEDGKRYVIPVYRGDAWGDGLMKAAKDRFTQLGGTFLEGIRYAPEATEFSAEASDLSTKVANAVATYGKDKVAILHISFEEANNFITAASAYDVLSTVKWYGSDGTSLSGTMLEDPTVANFAMKVGYQATIFAPTHSAKWEMVRQNGIKVLGREPESYSYAIYDIVWAYALSLLKVDSYNATAVRGVLPQVTAKYFGASGYIDLDENGDRKAGDYDIWGIVQLQTGKYDWQHIGTYELATDSVVLG